MGVLWFSENLLPPFMLGRLSPKPRAACGVVVCVSVAAPPAFGCRFGWVYLHGRGGGGGGY